MSLRLLLITLLKKQYNIIVAIFAILLLLPIPLSIGNQAATCAYVIIIMMVLWVTDSLPLGITAMLPVALFPILGIMDSNDVSQIYMKEINMMLLGGLVIAISIEECNLHKRISLKMMIMVGSKPRWLLMGFMIITMSLSMWLSNTATTAMMVPIVDAVLQEINSAETSSTSLRRCMMIGTAYAANLGGTGTIIGTGPNLVLKGFLDDNFGSEHRLTFATWMLFNIPNMLICVVIAWFWMQLLFIGFKKSSEPESKEGSNIKQVLQEKYDELGPIKFQEIAILVLFAITALLWFFRAPFFITGWADYIKNVKVKGSAPVILVVIIMFLVPAKPMDLWHGKKSPGLITWSAIHQKMPWSLFFLIGGGLAIGEGMKETCLSYWIGTKMLVLKGMSPSLILFIVTCFSTFFTEIASNTATANILIPMMKELAMVIDVNPLYLMLGVAVSCSFAFMLPIATPPNAIVFDAGKMKTKDMIRSGFIMNLLCIAVINFSLNTYGTYIFNFDEYGWANTTTTGNSTHRCEAILNL